MAVFDENPKKIGKKINTLTVQPMEEITDTIKNRNIRIGIITVPAVEAQNVADQLIGAGIEAILNFAPTILKALSQHPDPCGGFHDGPAEPGLLFE